MNAAVYMALDGAYFVFDLAVPPPPVLYRLSDGGRPYYLLDESVSVFFKSLLARREEAWGADRVNHLNACRLYESRRDKLAAADRSNPVVLENEQWLEREAGRLAAEREALDARLKSLSRDVENYRAGVAIACANWPETPHIKLLEALPPLPPKLPPNLFPDMEGSHGHDDGKGVVAGSVEEHIPAGE